MEGGGVKLYGSWGSPYYQRVILALKLKGINNYEYIQEDLFNKSDLLLQYNPIYKKIPVLVHHGKPIVESMIILEYIEETWPENPLMPKDAHERALARFWINYGESKQQIFNDFFRSTNGDAQAKKGEEVVEVLKTLEEKGIGDKKFFGGNSVGLVDLSYGWLAYLFEVVEEILGTKLFDPTNFPRLHAWVHNFKQVPVIKQNLPDRQRLLAHCKGARDYFVALDLSSQK